jgi:DNA-binding CsgD family transcriptional regulator
VNAIAGTVAAGSAAAEPVVDELAERRLAGSRTYVIDVRDETTRRALLQVGSMAGWEARRTVAPGCHLVVDAVRAQPHDLAARTVLVVDATPFAADRGLSALVSGNVAAVMSGARPSGLVRALESLSCGWGGIPLELLSLAAAMPDLTERQLAVVGAVISGQPTHQIARGLYLSHASIKRELGLLFRSFGAENRIALAALGSQLGVPAARVGP